MKKNRRQSRTKKGFTLTEVLVAVAIIAVLCAIGIPAAVSYQKKMETLSCNQAAQDIYLSVQNKLSGMKAQGVLSPATTGVDADSTITLDGYSLYYYDSESYPSSGPLSDISLSSLEGEYTVYFDMNSGSAYKVEYTNENGKEGSYTAVNFVPGLSQHFGNEEKTVFPKVDVIDGTDLKLKITIPVDCYAGANKFVYDFYFTDSDSHTAKIEKTFDFSEVNNGVKDITISPDNSKSGKDVISRSDLNGLNNSDFYTVKAEVSIDKGSTQILTDVKCDTNFVRFHTLYGNATTDKTIEVRTVRHLNNLRYYDGPTDQDIVVLQTADIAIPDSFDFKPINNTKLFGNESSKGCATYNGKNNRISNLRISESSNNVGLFGITNGCDINDVTLVDPRIEGRGCSNVGALAGHFSNGTINNCYVYLENHVNSMNSDTARIKDHFNNRDYYFDVYGFMYVGGLVGLADNCTVQTSCAAVDVGGGYYVGGLLGEMNGTAATGSEITLCYSSGTVTNVISDENAIGTFEPEKSYTGGLAGYVDEHSSANYCYTTSDVCTDGMGGGFAGMIVDATSCYSYGQVTDWLGLQSNRFLGGFTSAESAKFAGCRFSRCVYLSMEDYNDENYTDGAFLGSSSAELAGAVVNGLTWEECHPYDSILRTRKNPFPFVPISYTSKGSVKYMEHYGNWPE